MRQLRVRPRLFFILALCTASLLILVPLAMRGSMSPFIYSLKRVPQAQAALVLGASVYDGKPSPILAARADTAIALYRAHKVSAILVSGDNQRSSYDEVDPVRRYLLAAGVPARAIFLDRDGVDTYDSMYRARAIFHARSLIVVTQPFHMPRALWIARRLGLRAYGVESGGHGSLFDVVREMPASVKALFDVTVMRPPHYSGQSESLTGDGEQTW